MSTVARPPATEVSVPPTPCPEHAATPVTGRLELADVLNRYGDSYRRTGRLPLSHLKVLHAIESCRTARLGGHREHCESCGFTRYAYNSCRNRHCPKCQALAKAAWLEARQDELLPVPYFHHVFTLPHELNPVILAHPDNKRLMLNLLFQAASQTLLSFGRQNLGGQVGFTAVLHTWDQTLGAHFHLHCVVAAGALSEDHEQWHSADSRFLFPVCALSKVFRAKFLEGVKQAYDRKKLLFPGPMTELGSTQGFARWLDPLWQKSWVVYAKKPFGGPRQVLDYLGRYTHRVAISNHRLVNIDDGQVTFRYRNRRAGDRVECMTLDAHEFIRRFLLHVLPHQFVRIRHYGFLASRCKAQALSRCRQLLQAPNEPPACSPTEQTTAQRLLALLGIDVTRCPRCGHAPLIRTELLPDRLAGCHQAAQPAILDSS